MSIISPIQIRKKNNFSYTFTNKFNFTYLNTNNNINILLLAQNILFSRNWY